MVNSCTLGGGCRDWFLMHSTYCTLDRWRFGLRMIGIRSLFLPPAFFLCGIMPLCLELTTGFFFLLTSACCLGLRPPAAMTDGWFTRVQAVSSAGLCNTFMEHHDRTVLLGARCFGHAYVFHPCDVTSPAQLYLKQNGLYAEQAGSLEDFSLWHVVLPFDAKEEAQAALVKPLK